jgi:hypothetical protein
MSGRPRRLQFISPKPARPHPGLTAASIASIPEDVRRKIFTALIEARNAGVKPEAARYAVARRFVVTVLKVEAIEDEGEAKKWVEG